MSFDTRVRSTLRATRDLRKVSLWLGHASTQTTDIYLQADPTVKLEALAAMTPIALRPGKFRPPDKLIAALRRPKVMRTRQPIHEGGKGRGSLVRIINSSA